SSAVDEVRESLLTAMKSEPRKWSDSGDDAEHVKAAFRLIAKRQLYGIVHIIWKDTEKWDLYHQNGQAIYDKGVKNAQEPMTYAKPMATLKLHLLGIVLADLYGHILHQNKYRLKLKSNDLRSITVNGIFDSDIQGEKNQEIFREVMGGVNELPQTEEATGIRTTFNPSISTEQDEPLLLLPDYMAGFYYSKKMYGKGQENSRGEILHALEPILDKWPSECFRVFEYHFGEKYLLHPEVFDFVLPKKQREAFLSELLGPQSD
ncbi:MAG: hypothetical protein KGJ48_15615, partial [Nitrospirota bacterium]|nr:hypothetical protein [Nitrospirota bacterium]